MPNLELSLVFPVYNEAHVLQQTLESVLSFASGLGPNFEIIVVDDGSTDGTGLVLAGLERKHPQLRGISLHRNEGKGAALQRGVLEAKGQKIVTLDVDLSTDLEAIPRALMGLEEGYAVVFGDRHHPQSRIARRQSRFREQAGRLFNGAAKRLVWNQVRDYTCGFKAYRREAAKQLFENLCIARWAFDVELFAIAKARCMKVHGIPVRWGNHADTKVRLPQDALRALADLLNIVVRARLGNYNG